MEACGKALWRSMIPAVCAASLTIPVYAQELEEIVVVARKREESLQEVPISITTFSQEDLMVQGIDSLEDIARQSAGIIFDKGFSPQDTRVVMRGLSPTRGRPNVAVLLDDVDVSSEAIRTSGSSLTVNPRLIDIERIEIVRGPQSALYGRSAFGGAIHYVTRRPGAERRGQLSVDVSAEGKREIMGSASGPLSDNFFVGFNFAAWNEDGYYQNTVTGGDVGGQQGVGFTLTGGAGRWGAGPLYGALRVHRRRVRSLGGSVVRHTHSAPYAGAHAGRALSPGRDVGRSAVRARSRY